MNPKEVHNKYHLNIANTTLETGFKCCLMKLNIL